MTWYRRKLASVAAMQVQFHWDRNKALIEWCHGKAVRAGSTSQRIEVLTPGGSAEAGPGDWVVEELPQKFAVWSNEDFCTTFRRVE